MNLYDVVVAKKLSGGGGGGSSDFSTATVTVNANTTNKFVLENCPFVVDAGVLAPEAPAILYPMNEFLEQGANEVRVPLYKGNCVWMLSNFEGRYTVSGNIVDWGGAILITGDGTLTITD